MIDLPVGEDWKNKKVKITRRKFYPESDTLIMTPPVSVYKEYFVEQHKVDLFFNQLEKLKGKDYNNDSEIIIMKLALLTLNGNKKAREILFNYRTYIDYPLDGAAAETWNEYTSLVEYLNK